MNKINPMLLNNSVFISGLRGLQGFVMETGADIDMAYDWLCDQAGITSFVCDMDAWSCFYDVYMDAAE
jgi:hypothetical protein